MDLNKYIKLIICLLSACVLFYSTEILALEEQEDDVIRIGYSTNTNDFVEHMDNSLNKGYGYDVFRKIEEVSDLKFEFIPIEGDLYEAVDNGIVDLAGFVTKDEERASEYYYSKTPYSKTYAVLLSDNPDEYYNDPEMLDEKSVATYQNNIGQKNLDLYAQYEGITIHYEYSDRANYTNLDTDYYIGYSGDDFSNDMYNVLNLGVYNLFIISSFENRELNDIVDNYMLRVVASEGNFFSELEQTYLTEDNELNHRRLSLNETNILRSRTLDVGYIQDYAPISYQDKEGNPAGVLVDVLNYFAEIHEFDVIYHPYSINDDPMTYQNYDMLLTLYDIDHQLTQSYDNTEELFTMNIHMESEDSEKNATETGEHTTIGTLPYHYVNFDRFTSVYQNIEMKIYTNWELLLDDYAAGKIENFISTEAGIAYAAIYLDRDNLSPTQTDLEIPFHLYISKELSEEYTTIFNVIFDGADERVIQSIISQNTTSYYPDLSMFDYMQRNGETSMLVISLVLSIVFALGFYRQRKEKMMVKKAYSTDSLTGVMSIQCFTETMQNKLLSAYPNEYELISFDIDLFKSINTHYGTIKGTELIKVIAECLKQAYKKQEAIIARRTAEQFLILRKKETTPDILDVYKKVMESSINQVLEGKYTITMSFGILVIDHCLEDVSTLIAQADTARVLEKSKHQTTFTYFNEELKKIYRNKIDITFRMEKAIENQEFTVVYQPKIDFKLLRVAGAEALVRWHSKEGQPVYPNDFIPVFEDNGFISRLDLFVLKEVCMCIKEHCEVLDLPQISVNLSAYTILEHNVERRIVDIVQAVGININQIELEITESAIIGNEDQFLSKVKKLKDYGFKISIDDFGAGVSSLNRLSAIEADVLKLDKAFFDSNKEDKKSGIIVENVIEMAKKLNMKVVAEGVETQQQANWLKSIQCDYAQGYYFERPITKEMFLKILREKKVYKL